jgi:hypothetical protein
MGASLLRILVLVLLPSILIGQSLNLSVTKKTSDNNSSTFLLDRGEVVIGSESLQFLNTNSTVSRYEAFGISPDGGSIGVLKRSAGEGRVILLDSAGDTLSSYSAKSLASDDPSLAIFPFNNGSIILRDNITNFTFYNTFGEIATNMSSSSQSKEGEAISEVAMSPQGETVVVYNPKIKRNGSLGSKAQVMLGDKEFHDIHFSTDRYLKEVNVSEDGNFIVAVTAQEGTQDRVLIMDKFGNELNNISSDEDLVGTSLSDNAEYITLFSTGRVMVYSTLDGDRLGATSLRSTVFLADYFPEDNVILVLMGSYSENTGVLNNVEFRAINIGERKIASKEFSGDLGFNNVIITQLVRTSADEYQLIGSSKHVTIKANF